jgi:decaprenylphospho-beta-D-erythro-pentofuranosid-2-ulose 2-reductase
VSPNDSDKRPGIIVLGALSAIAEQAARLWAERGARLLLAGRDSERLEAVASDLRLRGAEVETYAVDLTESGVWRALPEMADRLGRLDVVLLAYGTLGDQKKAETELDEAQRILATNFLSAAGWCLAAANILEKQRHGTLIVIGSVAGDRGRASNYVYGASKGGLAVIVQGIAHRLAKAGARAVLVKPGFVDTPMTAHIARKGFLWAKPAAIGKTIASIADSGSRNRTAVYAPGFWRWIMLVIRTVPNFIFHRTNL